MGTSGRLVEMNKLQSLRAMWRIVFRDGAGTEMLLTEENNSHLQWLRDQQIASQIGKETSKIIHEERMNKLEHLMLEAKREKLFRTQL